MHTKSLIQKTLIVFTLMLSFLVSCDGTKSPQIVNVLVNHLNDGGTLVLQNNGGDNLKIEGDNGNHTFKTAIAVDEDYEVTIKTQPSDQTCVVTDGEGTVEADVEPQVTVACGKVIFITDAETDGDIGGIEGADEFCMNDANKPNDGKTYKAILADENNRRACTTADCDDTSAHRDWVLAPDTTYVRKNDTIIGTTNSGGIFPLDSGGMLLNSYKGGAQEVFWVGVIPDWTEFEDCENWTSNNGGDGSSVAVTNAIDADAVAAAPISCDEMFRLACVEQ